MIGRSFQEMCRWLQVALQPRETNHQDQLNLLEMSQLHGRRAHVGSGGLGLDYQSDRSYLIERIMNLGSVGWGRGQST
jgi:hypothetical protein